MYILREVNDSKGFLLLSNLIEDVTPVTKRYYYELN